MTTEQKRYVRDAIQYRLETGGANIDDPATAGTWWMELRHASGVPGIGQNLKGKVYKEESFRFWYAMRRLRELARRHREVMQRYGPFSPCKYASETRNSA